MASKADAPPTVPDVHPIQKHGPTIRIGAGCYDVSTRINPDSVVAPPSGPDAPKNEKY